MMGDRQDQITTPDRDRTVAELRRRLDRQARVGILPNTNRVALPPPHRPPLIGKWMRLRSTRRPPVADGLRDRPVRESDDTPARSRDDAAGSPVQVLVVDSVSGAIRGIDVETLNRAVAGLGIKSASRSGYAGGMTPEAPAASEPWRPRSPAPEPDEPSRPSTEVEATLHPVSGAAVGAAAPLRPVARLRQALESLLARS